MKTKHINKEVMLWFFLLPYAGPKSKKVLDIFFFVCVDFLLQPVKKVCVRCIEERILNSKAAVAASKYDKKVQQNFFFCLLCANHVCLRSNVIMSNIFCKCPILWFSCWNDVHWTDTTLHKTRTLLVQNETKKKKKHHQTECWRTCCRTSQILPTKNILKA